METGLEVTKKLQTNQSN